jgi:predicted nuclease with TOPRIM domain
MTQEQRLSQVEELLADQMHKQDYIYEEVLILKGNLDRMNRAVGTLVETARVPNGDVTYLMNKTNVIVEKVTEIDERVGRLETKFDILETKFDVLETKFDSFEAKVDNIEKDIVDMKGDMGQVKGLLTKILEKVDK